jgi:hypothetical protein
MTDPQIEGMTLAQRLTRGPLEPGKALDILEQLLVSLEASHDLGLVHGSISPKKIIVTSDGTAALTGFPGRDPGAEPMARFGKDAAEPGYVAPEQIADDPVGPATDLYSLGVVAYAMLVGKDPFGASEGVAADDVYYRILYKPSPQVPKAVLTGLPASVGPAIERAMSKEPQSRFLDAGSFLRSLRADSAVVPAPAPPDPKQVRREEEQRRREEEKKREAEKRQEEQRQREEEKKRRGAERLAALNLAAEKRGETDLEKQTLAASKQEEKERKDREKVAAAWGAASAAPKGRGWSRQTLALAAGVVILLLIIGVGAAFAMGAIGGSTQTTVAALETTTTKVAAVDDSTTTTTKRVTTTVKTSTTTTVATTTTTLPPPTTLSTVSSTTTTAKTTTTTVKPTTTTAKTTTTTARTNISSASIAAIPATTYTSSAHSPSLTVTYGGKTLVNGTDYTVAYANAINAGTATATITGKGSYTGSKSASFTIGKATPVLSCPNRTVAYTGTDYYLTGTVTGIGGVVLSDLSYGPYSAIGVYDVTVSYPGNGNYNDIPSQLRQLTIQ